MPCIEPRAHLHRLPLRPALMALCLSCLSACQLLSPKGADQPVYRANTQSRTEPARTDPRVAVDEVQDRIDTPSATTAGKGKGRGKDLAAVKALPLIKLPPPARPGSLAEARLQSAKRLLAANPSITYTSRPPDVLLAIPVLTVDLNADGSIRRIEVMRYPRQARDTVEIAKEALRRAAPFGDVSRLPKPWRFNETFLFNDQRQFKPLTLDR